MFMLILALLMSGCAPTSPHLTICTNWDLQDQRKVEAMAASGGYQLRWVTLAPWSSPAQGPAGCDLWLLKSLTLEQACFLTANLDKNLEWATTYESLVSHAGAIEGSARWGAYLSDGPQKGLAISLLDDIREEFGPGQNTGPPGDNSWMSLLSDLLDSTLEQARPELRAAERVLQDNPHETARRWLVEPPPWPPASINKLHANESTHDLVTTLATELAPDLESRHWLLASWGGEPRPIDPTLLKELAGVAGGKLIHEPRFRAWLRVEWTNWARQRYRRVARLVAQGESP